MFHRLPAGFSGHWRQDKIVFDKLLIFLVGRWAFALKINGLETVFRTANLREGRFAVNLIVNNIQKPANEFLSVLKK